jgi:hypothetical protein
MGETKRPFGAGFELEARCGPTEQDPEGRGLQM